MESGGPSRAELWLLRLLNVPVELACRAMDLLVLLPRPLLLFAWMRLWVLEVLRSPYRWPRSFEAVRLLKTSGQSVNELMYGELPVFSALWLFLRSGLLGGRCALLDLGAGRGRPLLAARWLGAAARGVELLPAHVHTARRALRAVGARLEEGDLLRAELGAPTHVLLNWCGLSDASRAAAEARLATLPRGTVVMAVGVAPESEAFERRRAHLLLFTWGLARVHVYQRR